MMNASRPFLVVVALVGTTTAHAASRGTAAEAKAFVQKVDVDLRRLWVKAATADWIKATYITDDTERNDAAENEELMAYLGQAQKQATRFAGVKTDAQTTRMLTLLRVAATLPAPADAKERAELAKISTELEGMYGAAKYCKNPADPKTCKDLPELEEIMGRSRNESELLDAWVGWQGTARAMRPMYVRLVELANKGAREIGFADLGAVWRSGYDMSPDAFEKETQRLWGQVKPLYDQLHCYVRSQLAKTYPGKIPLKGKIPAHLLGNMWAQDFSNIYPLVEPYKGQTSLDVTSELRRQGYDPLKLVRLGESFFTSMGLDPLPQTFWARSQFTKPRDRDVVCHASAWDVQYDNDLRVKMCIKVDEEDLVTIHHELGHDYYFHSYYKLPILFQQGANDGFHEAIGDALTLSITPAYLKQLGLIHDVPSDEKGLINFQMKNALDKIAFLPFGLLVDEWRWMVFSGKVKPSEYNAAWWKLREELQGVSPPIARSESDFDPGAKYHVPANTPYMRYFLARILQFQFHRAMCRAAGWTGPLHECSIYGNKVAGEKLRAMLALGASKPWQEALYAMTGEREMDATAILEYFAPLQAWLKKQNEGRTCGW